MKFKPNKLDFRLSPYSGLTRESWVEAGIYLLAGVFQHISSINDPVIVKRTEMNITYPHLNAPEEKQKQERKSEIFEGLARTFFVAAPLIRDNPEIEVCGKKLKDYYKNHILRICNKNDELYVGDFKFLRKTVGTDDEYRTFQQTVEMGALGVGLWICEVTIWNSYTKNEQDLIAAFIDSYAHEATVPQNWRFFNMLGMAFLHKNGYPIDKAIMAEHTQATLGYYTDNGWYRDGLAFDYYSCWGFNLYAPIWNLLYGYENEPFVAKQFEIHSNMLMETYPDFFDEDAYTNMWGRSSIYRNAAASAFVGNLFLKDSKIDYGLARRILSGSLMQFLGREDFLSDGIPSLGYYKTFAPLVQSYSCAASPFWLAKVFLVLYFPKEHPIWTAKENNGSWEHLRDNGIKETVLDGPALCYTNHKSNGETILRTGKVTRGKKSIRDMWAYSKLVYNTKYPWEATPLGHDDIESQQYVIHDAQSNECLRGNITAWAGSHYGVLYRRQFFGYDGDSPMHRVYAMNLADFPVACGVLRVDKLRPLRWQFSATLGSYGFPDNGTEVIYKTEGNAKAIILKGTDSTGGEKQLAMTVYDGWDELDIVRSQGTNPDSDDSIIIYAKTTRSKKYDGFSNYVLISQTITKENHDDFSDSELFPIRSVEYSDTYNTGAFGNIILELKDGTIREVCFDGIESRLMI